MPEPATPEASQSRPSLADSWTQSTTISQSTVASDTTPDADPETRFVAGSDDSDDEPVVHAADKEGEAPASVTSSQQRSATSHAVTSTPTLGAKRGSLLPKVAAAVLAATVLGGGAAFALTKFGGDATAPSASSSPAGVSASGGAAPTSSAQSKPSTMPDLKGKSLDDAQKLLSSQVNVQVTKTDLVEDMSGAALITEQDVKPGAAVPGTVKVTLRQPANVTPISEASGTGLIVGNNPLNETQKPSIKSGHTYKHVLEASMYDTERTEPNTLELNLNQGYSRLRGEASIDTSSLAKDKKFTVVIKGDDHQLKKFDVSFNQDPVGIDLDVSHVTRLTIEITISGGSNSDNAEIAFGDLRLLAEPGRTPSSATPTT